ncbi:CRISPR-associated endonuclease Cas3'' [Opitutaceae bacterium TAV4]|nr:CRISPR-associated endonuclease Cas3'' [Opitutaceae bacterium TAV4]
MSAPPLNSKDSVNALASPPTPSLGGPAPLSINASSLRPIISPSPRFLHSAKTITPRPPFPHARIRIKNSLLSPIHNPHHSPSPPTPLKLSRPTSIPWLPPFSKNTSPAPSPSSSSTALTAPATSTLPSKKPFASHENPPPSQHLRAPTQATYPNSPSSTRASVPWNAKNSLPPSTPPPPPPPGKILIATQAIEAGVDISARTLITELAPWSSLVQRFGRCNRKGEYNPTGGADILWINLESPPGDAKTADSLALPYTPEQLNIARALLRQTTDASPAALEKLHAEEALPETSILRCKDLVELFDTTPDLSGLDIDVGRYIRDGEDRDVQLFWRELPKTDKNTSAAPLPEIQPQRPELVRVSVADFKKFADKNKGDIWKWVPLEGEWQEFRDTWRIAPGQIYLINATCGGYSETLGWTGEKTKEPIPLPPPPTAKPAPRDGAHDDESQLANTYQSIEQHTEAVLRALDEKLQTLPAAAPWTAQLITAARWHDTGKAHASFQHYLTQSRDDIPETLRDRYLAKSTWQPGVKNERPQFRHELASTLAWLQFSANTHDRETQNLVAWLIATHHGKVRLSLRAFPGELPPPPLTAFMLAVSGKTIHFPVTRQKPFPSKKSPSIPLPRSNSILRQCRWATPLMAPHHGPRACSSSAMLPPSASSASPGSKPSSAPPTQKDQCALFE